MMIQSDNLTKKNKTLSILAGLRNLPSIPKVVFEVTKILADPNFSVYKLSELISKDQGLTTRLLTVANSPLYGIKRKVSSIEFAILVLGSKEIKDLVTALTIVDSFSIKNSKDFDPYEFWIHSMIVGSAAKSITQNLGFDFHADSFVAGILHDLGIVILNNHFPKEFSEILNKHKNEGMPFLDAETDVLGINHQQIGRFLADKWNLPVVLCESFEFHHNPSLAKENPQLTAIIHLVDYMAKTIGIGKAFWDADVVLDKTIIPTLRFNSESDIDNMIIEYEELFKTTADSLKI